MVNWQKRNSVDVRPTDVGWKDKRSICPGQRCACNSPLQPPCVGQRSPTVQMTPSLFQLQNFHTPFPISSLPGNRPPQCPGCVPCPKQENATLGHPPAHHSVSVRTLHRRNQHIRSCPNRFCPNVSCPNLFYLTILCAAACCGRPCFVFTCFVSLVVLSP